MTSYLASQYQHRVLMARSHSRWLFLAAWKFIRIFVCAVTSCGGEFWDARGGGGKWLETVLFFTPGTSFCKIRIVWANAHASATFGSIWGSAECGGNRLKKKLNPCASRAPNQPISVRIGIFLKIINLLSLTDECVYRLNNFSSQMSWSSPYCLESHISPYTTKLRHVVGMRTTQRHRRHSFVHRW